MGTTVELDFPAYAPGNFRSFAQCVVPGLPVMLSKDAHGLPTLATRHRDDVLPILRRERWVCDFTRYAPCGIRVFGLLWLPGKNPRQLAEHLETDGNGERRCNFVALSIASEPATKSLDETFDVVTLSGLQFATYFPAYRFDFQTMKPIRARAVNRYPLKQTRFEEHAVGWLLKNANNLDVLFYEQS